MSYSKLHLNILDFVSIESDEPVMTDEERLAAIAKQYAVLNNRTAGIVLELFRTVK